ncbi:MAG: RNA polymerase sigma factor [Desulfobacterales bacterium]|jgi:RNA polymerase sigma-70 factor (ECF subfamily)
MLQLNSPKYHVRNLTEEARLNSLAAKAKRGNSGAFERLYGRFQTEVFRMVYYRIRSQQDAEDLTQDIFLKAYEKISGLKDTDRFRSWLFSIARNRVCDFQRKKRIKQLLGFSTFEENSQERSRFSQPDYQAPQENMTRQDFWRLVGGFIGQLSKMEREVFLLRFLDQFSLNEISQVLKKTESTVKTHLYRALVKFKNASEIIRRLREEAYEK